MIWIVIACVCAATSVALLIVLFMTARRCESLREGGVIVMHDCLPTTEEMQEWHNTSQQGKVWTGDTWKAYVKAMHSLPYLVYVIDTDFGCGIIDTSKRSHSPFRAIDMELLEWKHFDKSKLNVKDGIIP